MIWRSPDGYTWSKAALIPLGTCNGFCPTIEQLAAGPGGVILSWTHPLNSARSRMYWSEDGEAWPAVEKSAFDVPRLRQVHPAPAIVVDGRFVVAGAGCNACGRVWSSSDGRVWTEDAVLTTHPSWVDLASDGSRAVVLEHGFGDRETRVWTTPNGRTDWEMGSVTLPIVTSRLTFAGGAFIAAGQGSGGIRTFTSPDGLEWTEHEADFEVNGCRSSLVTALAGSDDLVVLAGLGRCHGIWVSRAPEAP